jgi:hypothetical protein
MPGKISQFFQIHFSIFLKKAASANLKPGLSRDRPESPSQINLPDLYNNQSLPAPSEKLA